MTEVHMIIKIHFWLISVSSQFFEFICYLEITLTVNIFNTKIINTEAFVKIQHKDSKCRTLVKAHI